VNGLGKTLAYGLPTLLLSAPAFAADGDTAPAFGLAWGAPLLAVAASLVSLSFAYYFYKKVIEAPAGNDKMIEIANHVQEGAYAYLFRQYKVVAVVFAVLVAIFGVLAYKGIQNPFVPIAFLTGGFFTAACAAFWV
jgi:K(+)-stimulated pyrophosphate-energized sodium pump